MRNNVGTNARDAETSRKNARKDGERDGQRNFPPRDPDGSAARDHNGRANQREAETTDAVTKAAHLQTHRVDDDRQLGEARANTARTTTEAADSRADFEEAKAEQRACEQSLPISAKFGFWPRWVVYVLLVALGIGSGAAVTAALLEVTSDQTNLTYVIGFTVAVATVVGGAALGTLLRRRDLDLITDGHYSSSGRYTTGVLLVGAIGVLAIACGVAGLRHDASQAAAVRQANRTSISVFIPGQKPSGKTSQAPATPKGVNWPIWLALELGIATAATSIEFQRSDIRAEHKERLDRRTAKAHLAWKNALGALCNALTAFEQAIATRADHDLSVILAGSGQRSFADVLTNDYRGGNLGARGHGGASPFEDLDEHERLNADLMFETKPGVDVLALRVDEVDAATMAKLYASSRDLVLLEAAYRELGTVPTRPTRAQPKPWVPGAYLATDSAAQALRKVNVNPDSDIDLNHDVETPIIATIGNGAANTVSPNLDSHSHNGSSS
jgi:hypothetical protein